MSDTPDAGLGTAAHGSPVAQRASGLPVRSWVALIAGGIAVLLSGLLIWGTINGASLLRLAGLPLLMIQFAASVALWRGQAWGHWFTFWFSAWAAFRGAAAVLAVGIVGAWGSTLVYGLLAVVPGGLAWVLWKTRSQARLRPAPAF